MFYGKNPFLAQITDKAKYRDGLPDTISVDYIPFVDLNDQKKSTQRTLDALKTSLNDTQTNMRVCVLNSFKVKGGIILVRPHFLSKLLMY